MAAHEPTVEASGDGDAPDAVLVAEARARLAQGARAPGELGIEAWGTRDGVRVLALAGEMDMSNAPQVRQRLDGSLGAGSRQVIVELSLLTFIDSSGIGELVAAAKALRASGGALVLASPAPHVARVFEITKLGDVVVIAESFEAALRSTAPPDGGSDETDAAHPMEGVVHP